MSKKISWNKIKDEIFTQSQIEEINQRASLRIALRKLKELRERNGLTQKELAEKSGLPRSTISKIESGYQNTSLLKIIQIANALGKEVKVDLV